MPSLSNYILGKEGPFLRIERLSTGYDRLKVLEDITFTIMPGKTLAITGKNGVGKTTLLRAIMGQAEIWSGHVRYGEIDLTRLPPSARAQHGIGYVPQGRRIFPDLSGWENLAVAGYGAGGSDWKKRQEQILEYFPTLRGYLGRKGRTLSGGQQQLLSLARALVLNPEILLLDEPSEGVQPNIVDQMVEIIERFQVELGVGVLLIEQNIGLIEDMASTVAIMDRGRIIKLISMQEGKFDSSDIENFLGFSSD